MAIDWQVVAPTGRIAFAKKNYLNKELANRIESSIELSPTKKICTGAREM